MKETFLSKRSETLDIVDIKEYRLKTKAKEILDNNLEFWHMYLPIRLKVKKADLNDFDLMLWYHLIYLEEREFFDETHRDFLKWADKIDKISFDLLATELLLLGRQAPTKTVEVSISMLEAYNLYDYFVQVDDGMTDANKKQEKIEKYLFEQLKKFFETEISMQLFNAIFQEQYDREVNDNAKSLYKDLLKKHGDHIRETKKLVREVTGNVYPGLQPIE
jgi:hypothetical protein